MRQLGGAFGVAILTVAFGGASRYTSVAAFSEGYKQAILVAAGIALAGAAAGAMLPFAKRSTLELGHMQATKA